MQFFVISTRCWQNLIRDSEEVPTATRWTKWHPRTVRSVLAHARRERHVAGRCGRAGARACVAAGPGERFPFLSSREEPASACTTTHRPAVARSIPSSSMTAFVGGQPSRSGSGSPTRRPMAPSISAITWFADGGLCPQLGLQRMLQRKAGQAGWLSSDPPSPSPAESPTNTTAAAMLSTWTTKYEALWLRGRNRVRSGKSLALLRGVVTLDNQRWSLYGAQRSEPVANGRAPRTGSDKRKPLPSAGASCLSRSVVRRGSSQPET